MARRPTPVIEPVVDGLTALGIDIAQGADRAERKECLDDHERGPACVDDERTAMYAHATLGIIHAEHSVLSAMLRTIGLLLAEHRRRDTLPDFPMLRAMLFYVDEFPERLHHTKESELLFPRIRERSDGELAQVLDRLDGDHSRSQQAVRELQHELLGLEMMNGAPDGESRRVHFEASMNEYIAAYLAHIHTEESVVLPMAERVLTAADWAGLDEAFMQNRDPMTQRESDDPYQPLFKRILSNLAAPLGLGRALDSMVKSSPREPFQVR